MNAWKTARLLPLGEIEWRVHCAKLPPCTSNSCESNFKTTIGENVSLKKSSHITLPIAEPEMLRKGELTLSLIFLQDLYLPLSLDDSDSLGDSMWRRKSPEYKCKLTVTIGYFCSSVQQGYWCFQIFILLLLLLLLLKTHCNMLGLFSCDFSSGPLIHSYQL